MEIRNKEFFVNWENQTRLSLLEGEELTSVYQLPKFLVECHVFRDGNMAESFVQGIQYTGLGNSIVLDWNPGTLCSNCCVLIGRLDEDRPDTDDLAIAIKFIEHKLSNHDSAAIAAGTKRSSEANEKIWGDNREKANPIADALVATGADPKKIQYFSSCVRFLDPKIGQVDVNFKDPEGPFQIVTNCYELFEGTLDTADLVIAKAAEYGFTLKRDGRDLSFDGIANIEGLPAKLQSMHEVEKACEQAKKDAWHQDFVSKTKVTASRRRFLKAGWELGGVHRYVNRANTRAQVGGEDIGQTEINVMLKMGWMVTVDRGFIITEAGAKAAGIEFHHAPVP